jgi:hypothetical protein
MVLFANCQCCSQEVTCNKGVPEKIVIEIQGSTPAQSYQAFTQTITSPFQPIVEWSSYSAIFPVNYDGVYELQRVPPPDVPFFVNNARFLYESSTITLAVDMDILPQPVGRLLSLSVLPKSQTAYVYLPGEHEPVFYGDLVLIGPCDSGRAVIPNLNSFPVVDSNIYPICRAGTFAATELIAQHFCQKSNNQLFYSANFRTGTFVGSPAWGSPPLPYFFGSPPPPFPYLLNFVVAHPKPFPNLSDVSVKVQLSSSGGDVPDVEQSFEISSVRYVYSDAVVDLPFL